MTQYQQWHGANLALRGPFAQPSTSDATIIAERVALLEQYKTFIDQQHYAEHFDARSNAHSSVLEEFCYYLFKDLVADISQHALIGKSRAFKDVFFRAPNFTAMLTAPSVFVERKDHDFVIGTRVKASLSVEGQKALDNQVWDIPAVAIECKTYLDKSMLEAASNSAEQLKARHPNSLYIVLAEWLKLTESVNLQKYKVHQIYVVRRDKNTDRELRYNQNYQIKPIHVPAVLHLFETVRDHITGDWRAGNQVGLERGFLL